MHDPLFETAIKEHEALPRDPNPYDAPEAFCDVTAERICAALTSFRLSGLPAEAPPALAELAAPSALNESLRAWLRRVLSGCAAGLCAEEMEAGRAVYPSHVYITLMDSAPTHLLAQLASKHPEIPWAAEPWVNVRAEILFRFPIGGTTGERGPARAQRFVLEAIAAQHARRS